MSEKKVKLIARGSLQNLKFHSHLIIAEKPPKNNKQNNLHREISGFR